MCTAQGLHGIPGIVNVLTAGCLTGCITTAGTGVRDGQQGSTSGSSSSQGSCHDEAAEEGAKINAFTQQMVAVLREPEMYTTLGLSEPPSSFHPLFMEDYAASFGRLL